MSKKIGNNTSSGAEKVERIEENKITPEEVDGAAPKKRTGGTKKSAPKKSAKTDAAKREKTAADRRVEAAKTRAGEKEERRARKAALKEKKLEKKAELKRRKLEKKQAIAERKLQRKEMLAKKKAERLENARRKKAALKEKKLERRAEKIARREMLKNESKAEREKRIAREKRERIALKRRKAEARENARAEKRKARETAAARKSEERRHRREQKTERRKHAPGFGGWLAAVISLGVACLALATVVTAGSFRLNDAQLAGESAARSTLYEMVSACEEMDDDLSKLRIASGTGEQSRLLTDVLVDSALMESALERIPVDAATGTDISGFVNRTSTFARKLLAKVTAGEPLTEEEKSAVAALCEINGKLHGELNALATTMTDADLRAFLDGKTGTVSERFGEMGGGARKGAETDAPFAHEGNVGENALASLPEVTASEAEALAKQYFEGYHVRETRYTGETAARQATCYDFVLVDENGTEIFAQITKNGGKLAYFETYEVCTQKNFDLPTCDSIAREYLGKLGIGDVEAVWLSDGGMIADLTYAAVEDGVRIYSELIRIRVCEEKGRVVGMDAMQYLVNDTEHALGGGMSEEEILSRVGSGLEVTACHEALVPAEGREVLAYELAVKYGEDEYIVYLDAKTGEEVQVYRVRSGARGKFIR